MTRWPSSIGMPICADPLDLGQGELGRDLVGGDAERIEAAGQVAGLEDDDVVPEPAQLVGAAQPGRSRADHGHPLARGRAGLEEPDAPVRRGVAGEPLEPADLHRRLRSASDRRRPPRRGPRSGRRGAAPAEDVGLEDRPGRADLVAVEDLADEPRDVDVRRAGPGARGVEAEQAARGLDPGLVARHRRRDVGESRAQVLEG